MTESDCHVPALCGDFQSLDLSSGKGSAWVARWSHRRKRGLDSRASFAGHRARASASASKWRASHRKTVFGCGDSETFLATKSSLSKPWAWRRAARLLPQLFQRGPRVTRKEGCKGRRRWREVKAALRRKKPEGRASSGDGRLPSQRKLKKTSTDRAFSLGDLECPSWKDDSLAMRIQSMTTAASIAGQEIDFGSEIDSMVSAEEFADVEELEEELAEAEDCDDAASCASSEYAGSEWFDIWESCPGGAPLKMSGLLKTKTQGAHFWHTRHLKVESGIMQYFSNPPRHGVKKTGKPTRVYNFHTQAPTEFVFNREKRILKLGFTDGKFIMVRPDEEVYLSWKMALQSNLKFCKVLSEADDRAERLRLDLPEPMPPTKGMPPPLVGELRQQISGLPFIWKKRQATLQDGVLTVTKNGSPRVRLDLRQPAFEVCADDSILRLEREDDSWQFMVETTLGSLPRWKAAIDAHLEYALQSVGECVESHLDGALDRVAALGEELSF